MPDLTLRPIGVIHTPFVDKVSAPRQTYVAPDAEGTIVLEPGHQFEHALEDLDAWDYLWVLYWFHLNEGWRPKVLPPRSKVRRGLFATRSPHRPSPIGMSVVKLVRVEGLTIHVRGVDMIDGTPVLDVKPYVARADSIPEAGAGWLASPEPLAAFEVVWAESARDEAAWLKESHGIDLVTPIERALALGPEPHAYRRIRKQADGGLRLAVKDWRVRFVAEEERRVRVLGIETGYRASQLAIGDTAAVRVHQAFCARWRNGPGPTP